MIKLIIGVFVLLLGFVFGGFLKKITRDEMQKGRRWFFILMIGGLIGGVVGLILLNDVLIFSFLFISIVSWCSWRR